MKKIFTLIAACILSVMGAKAEVTTIYERGGSGTAWSDADLTDWNTQWNTLSINESSLYSKAKNAGWSSTKTIATTDNSKVTFTAELYGGQAPGRSGSYDYVNVGGVELRLNGQDQKATVAVNGTTTNLSGFSRGGLYTITATIDQSTGDVTWTVSGKASGSGTGKVEAKVASAIFGHNRAGSEGYEVVSYLKSISIAEEAQEVTICNYTINYVLGGETVNSVTGSIAQGGNVNTLESFFVESVKYYRADGQPASVTIDTNNKVVNIAVRQASTFNYTVKAINGSDILATIATGSAFEGETAVEAYPEYIVDADGKLYEAPKGSSDWYRTTFTPNVDNFVQNIAYSSTSKTGIVFYTEAEDIAGVSVANYTNRASNGKVAHTGGADIFKDVTTLAPGVYTITVKGLNGNSANRISYFRVGDNNVFSFVNPNGTDNRATSLEFTVYSESTLKFSSEGSSASGLDWFYVVKTGDAPTTLNVAVNSSNTASLVAPCALDFTGSDLKAYVATAVSESAITLAEVTTVAAGQAIVVKGETCDVNVIAEAAAPAVNLFQSGAMTVAAGQNVYALSATDGLFHQVAEGVEIPAGKAYIVAATAAKTLTLNFGGEATGINNLAAAKLNGVAYNLMGQKVSANAKGIIIINGKKISK